MNYLVYTLVLLFVYFASVQSICRTSFITTCESVSDVVYYGKTTWQNLIISKSLCDDSEPTSLAGSGQTLEYGTFNNCVNLEEIYIINQLSDIQPGAFINLDHLTYLKLYKNEIKVVRQGTFTNLTQLYKLDLSNNLIENIQHGLFHSSNIRWIILSNNKLNNLQVDQVNIPSLKKLTLSQNDISILIPGCFHKNLEYLYLDNNKLEVLTPSVLEPLQKLKVLILSNNILDGISVSFEMGSLEKLDLSHNLIVGISSGSFTKFPELRYLDLSYNKLKHFSHKVLKDKNKLKVLKLNNNLLISLDGQFQTKLTSLEEISIGGNPWICSCLTQIDKVIKYWKIRQSDCEKAYFSNGEYPICSLTEGNNLACTGEERLTDDVYNGFQESVRYYKC